MQTTTFISTLAQESAIGADPNAGFYNTFILIVSLCVVIAIVYALIRGNKAGSATLASPATAPAKVVPAPAAVPATKASDDSVLVAILAAAAYATLGQAVKIVSIEPSSREWSVQGRRDIFQSHKFR